MDENYVLTGSDDNTVRLYDRESGKCLHSLRPDQDQNYMNKRLLNSSVTAVNMNDKQIAIGYEVGEMHLYDKLSGELVGVNLAGNQNKIEKILFAKFNCKLQPKQNYKDKNVDVIITISGGLVSFIFEDQADIEQHKQKSIGDKVLNSYLKFDTLNYCDWGGNYRLKESQINDFVIDEEQRFQIATENLVYRFSPPFTNDSQPDATQIFSNEITSISVNRNELICGLEDGIINIIDKYTGGKISEIKGHGSRIYQINAFELRK